MTTRERFKIAFSAKAKPMGRRLTPDEILDVCEQVVAEMKPVRAKKPVEDDAEWFANLKADPALSGVNIDAEWSRCCLWYRQNVSKTGLPTRRRFTNWLLKAERVIGLKSGGAQYATGLKLPPPEAPAGWLEWLKTELSLLGEDFPGYSQLLTALNCRNFHTMPLSWQTKCRNHFSNPYLHELPKEA